MPCETTSLFPVPWRREGQDVLDATGKVVFFDLLEGENEDMPSEWADWIIRVVNSHEAMKRALRAVRALYGARETWPEHMRRELDLAEAALKRADGH